MVKKDSFIKTISSYRYMFQFLKGHKISYIAGIIMLSCCGLIENIFTGKLYGAITSFSVSEQAIITSFVSVGILALVMVTLSILGNFLYTYSTANADKRLRKTLISKLLHMPMIIVGRRQGADCFSILGKDTDDAVESYKARTTDLFGYIVQAGGGFIILLNTSPSLALCALCIGLIIWELD